MSYSKSTCSRATKPLITPILVILVIHLVLGSPAGFCQHTFLNVTASMGISGQTGLGHAVGWGDIDNDGDPDLAFSNQEGDGFWFYRNEGDHFAEITNPAGLGGLGGNKIIMAEVTGDEFNDLILRTRSSTQHLFESNGDGTFNDITATSGIGAASIYNVADFNNDGFTDLLSVANSSFSILYNNGTATFQPPQVISTYDSFWGVAVLDYDRDGWMDIYHTTYGGSPNILLRNNGDGTFINTTQEAGLEYPDGAHGIDAGDFNNDGWIDIYLGSYSDLDCRLFQNNGDGTFTDVGPSTGTTGHHDTRTVAFVDYNSDGWLDIFSSHHDFYTYSNTMLRNNGDYTFTEVAVSLGLSGKLIGDYFGQGWADFNLDGAMDLFAAGHIDKYRLFKNSSCPGTGFLIRLVGVQSNPNGIGARVDVWSSGQRVSRNVLPSGGFHDFSSLDLHFGLNGAYSADSLIVHWPSGIIQKMGNVNAGQLITIVEDETTSAGQNPVSDGNGNLRVFPNPVMTTTTVTFHASGHEKVDIEIWGSAGREPSLIQGATVIPGTNTISLNLDNLEPGVYFLGITSGTIHLKAKLIKI